VRLLLACRSRLTFLAAGHEQARSVISQTLNPQNAETAKTLTLQCIKQCINYPNKIEFGNFGVVQNRNDEK